MAGFPAFTQRVNTKLGEWGTRARMPLITALLISSFCLPVRPSVLGADLSTYRPSNFKVGGDFELTGHTGARVTRDDLRGKPVMMAFGFTHCPDTCPVTVSTMSLLLKRLRENADDVRMVFVSVDPERDSPRVLKQYLEYFDGTILGLTGKLEEVEDMTTAYGVSFRKVKSNSAAGYVVNHTSSYYLIDRKGEIRYILPHETSIDVMLQGLQSLITESN